MGTIEILQFKVIRDAEGKPPTGKADSILNFYVKTLMNLSAGEQIRVRTKVDGIQTTNPPWEDSVVERDYVNEVFETNGSVQLDTDVGFNVIGGHTLEIIFETYTSAKTKFFTESELNAHPMIILGVVGLVGLAGLIIYAYTKRKH